MRHIQIILCLYFIISGCHHLQPGETKTVEKQPQLLKPLKKTIVPEKWLYAGPFSAGVREGAVDPFIKYGGLRKFVPKEGMQHKSFMAKEGKIFWRRTEAKKGKVELKYRDVDWKVLQESYGIAGLFCRGYAYCEFNSEDECRALAVAERVSSFILNGKTYPGDVYGRGFVKIPVILRQGKNRVMVSVSGFGDKTFTFRFEPPDAPVQIICKDITLPDLIEGEKVDSWIGVPFLNITNLTVKGLEFFLEHPLFEKVKDKIPYEIPPLCIMKIPFQIKSKGAIKTETSQIEVMVGIRWRKHEHRCKIKFRVRKKGESFKVTFISDIDRSVQFYGVLPPKNYKPDKKYAMIVSLHGAGCDAGGQVNAYSQKDWAYVIAPTNRRPFGFDWQDWGRLDAIEVIRDAQKRFNIDENRIYLTGHSMGGHGTWHIGLAHADLFSAIAPSAGWTSHQLYVSWVLQKSKIFAHPKIIALREMVLREDQPLNFLENAKNTPIYIIHGAEDDNVPPHQARMFVEELERKNIKYIYREFAGKKHWWTEKGMKGTACVDHPDLMKFFKGMKRDPFPRHIYFKTTSLGQTCSHFWLRINMQEIPYFDTTIEGWMHDKQIRVKTKNVLSFTITLNRSMLPYGDIEIVVDAKRFEVKFRKDTELTFCKVKGEFRRVKLQGGKLTKCPDFFGPIKQAFFTPFILVYGTKGTFQQTQANLHKARLFSFLWWRIGNGFVRIIPDTMVNEEIIRNYNLVLFGGPLTNTISERISKKLPIKIAKGEIKIGTHIFKGKNLAVQMIYPNPLNMDKFIVLIGGSGKRGEQIAGKFGVLYSSSGLPDFLIYDDNVLTKLWASVKAAGFFDNKWRICRYNTYLTH